MAHNTDALNYSQEEWTAVIDEAYKSLPAEYPTYLCPEPGSLEFAKLIDHTLLKLDATAEQIDKLCEEATKYQFKTVCVRLDHVPRAITALKGTGVDVACVVDFHEGTSPTAAKVQEALAATSASATELDLVLPHPLLHSPSLIDAPHAYPSIYTSILSVRTACPAPKTTLKVILETSQLSPYQIVAGSVLAIAAGADFVKTSTGFLGRGASVEDVRVMRAVAGMEKVLRLRGKEGEGEVRVKASGGIRSVEDVERMVQAGAGRIGASAGVGIMEEARGGVGGGKGEGGY